MTLSWLLWLILAAADAPTEFTARVVLSQDHHFESKWMNARSIALNAPPAEKAVRGEFIRVLPFFENATEDSEGSIHVVYDFKLLRPDGSVLLLTRGIKAAAETPGLKGDMLADQRLSIHFDDTDGPGVYRVELLLRDMVSDRRASVTAQIELVTSSVAGAHADDAELFTRMQNYYRRANSHEFLTLLGVVDHPLPAELKENEVEWTFAAFFSTLLADNAYLRPQFIAAINERPAEKRTILLPTVRLALLHDASLRQDLKLSESEWAAVDALQPPDPLQRLITSPRELDMEWARFYATGALRPVERVVNTAVELLEARDPEQIAIGKAAAQSLTLNARNHELIRAYCQTLLQFEMRELQPRTVTRRNLLAAAIGAYFEPAGNGRMRLRYGQPR